MGRPFRWTKTRQTGSSQVVYERAGEPEHTGEGDGPTSSKFHFVEAEGDIDPSTDERDDRVTSDD